MGAQSGPAVSSSIPRLSIRPSARRLLRRPNRAADFAVFRKSPNAIFREDHVAVQDDIVNTVSTRNEFRVRAKFRLNLDRQTGGPREVVSTRAVGNRDLHNALFPSSAHAGLQNLFLVCDLRRIGRPVGMAVAPAIGGGRDRVPPNSNPRFHHPAHERAFVAAYTAAELGVRLAARFRVPAAPVSNIVLDAAGLVPFGVWETRTSVGCEGANRLGSSIFGREIALNRGALAQDERLGLVASVRLNRVFRWAGT